jgi:hypothetical protein
MDHAMVKKVASASWDGQRVNAKVQATIRKNSVASAGGQDR